MSCPVEMERDMVIEEQTLYQVSRQQALSSSMPAQPTPNFSVHASIPIPRNTKSIRLLDLDGSQQIDDRLVGTLRLVTLDQEETPVFAALSYTWGTFASPKDTLRCGTGYVHITKNCQDALQQIRQLYGAVTLWVDAICIDQNNDEEKEHQVPLMRDIYTRASVVYIWLGKETPARAMALDCFDSAAKINLLPLDREHFKKHPPSWVQKAMFAAIFLPPYIALKLAITNWKAYRLRRSYDIGSLAEVLSEEWFVRAWTFQETALACDSVFICGSKVLRWDRFMRGFACLNCIFEKPYERFIQDADFIVHYGSKIVSPDIYHESKFHLPHAFQAFDLVLHIWMRIKRPKLGSDRRQKLQVPSTQSFYEYQKPYIDIQNCFLSKDGVFYLAIAHTISFYVIVVPYFAFCVYIDCAYLSILAPPLAVYFLLSPVLIAPPGAHNIKWSIGSISDEAAEEVEDALMEGVVHTIRQRKATNPKDKSYAVHGVLQTLGLQLSKPDYRKSQGQIYHELFWDLLRWRSSAIVLLLDVGKISDTDSDMAGAPSWVPDWSKLMPKPTISTNYFVRKSRRILDATPGLEPHIRIGKNPNELLVLGHWRGHITFCAAQFQEIDRASIDTYGIGSNPYITGSVATFKTWINAVRSNVRPLNPRRLRPRYDVVRVADIPGYEIRRVGTRSSSVQPTDASNSLDIYMVATQRSSTLEDNITASMMEDIYHLFLDTEIDFGLDSSFRRVVRQTARALWKEKDLFDYFVDVINDLARNDRRLFVTSDGFLGCGSKGVAIGDRLALVAGVPAPLALRPNNPSPLDWFKTDYKSVCSAFVLGWMDGSLFKRELVGEIKLV